MKKIIAVVLLVMMAVACVACSQNKTAKAPETKQYSYTIENKTGKTIDKVILADDNSANKAEITFENKMMDGNKRGVTISAVPDKEGNPSLTASYTIGSTEYFQKVHSGDMAITLMPEDQGSFDMTVAHQ